MLRLSKQRPRELSGESRIRSQVAEFPLCSHLHDLIDLLGIRLTCEDTSEMTAFCTQENALQKLARLAL